MIPVLVMMLAGSLSLTDAGNFTVTDEAWFNVVVEDLDGPGKNYTGKFVVALFGETVPMTVMNFVAITRGYERVNQVRPVVSISARWLSKYTNARERVNPLKRSGLRWLHLEMLSAIQV